MPENQLPVVLPTGVEFKGRGPSPLVQDMDWLRGDCGQSVTVTVISAVELQLHA